jgi:hypothetical protein
LFTFNNCNPRWEKIVAGFGSTPRKLVVRLTDGESAYTLWLMQSMVGGTPEILETA